MELAGRVLKLGQNRTARVFVATWRSPGSPTVPIVTGRRLIRARAKARAPVRTKQGFGLGCLDTFRVSESIATWAESEVVSRVVFCWAALS